MTLTKSDLKAIKGIVDTAIDPVKKDVSTLKTDVSSLKTDVSSLKTDVSVLKKDVSTLKKSVTSIDKSLKRLRKSHNAAVKVFDTVSSKHHKRLDRIESHVGLPRFAD